MHKLVLLRHGESIWNKENRFTGWTDVDLSEQGMKEAHAAGGCCRESGFVFDVAFTSVLKRAIRTLWIVAGRDGPDVDAGAELLAAERAPLRRAAGAEQGGDGGELRRRAGPIWRRSYDIPPPRSSPSDERWPGRDPRYRELEPAELPATECLKDTVARFLPYWTGSIAPAVKAGKRVIIAAHGNSIRALIKYLDARLGPGHRRAEHPDRRPAGLRAGRRAEAAAPLLPRRPGGDRGRGARRSRPRARREL